MNVALSENIEQYLIALPYPKDISDAIARYTLRKVERRPADSGSFRFDLFLTSGTDGQDYDFSISVHYEVFGDVRLVTQVTARGV